MKKLINDPREAVREMLEGLADMSPDLVLLNDENVVVRDGIPASGNRNVAVISGGGSGHEPAHAGFVGEGMLTAAVVGDVFTSPSVDAVYAAIAAAAGPAGVLLVVKNYTGDRLNFALAAELARQDGIPAEIVVVADDAALRDTVEPARRRGIAGTILVHKIAGAAAERGMPLADVARVARAAADDVVTMGIGLGACTVPTAGKPSFTLGEDEIEFGLGIHGEKGVRRAPIQKSDAIVEAILETLLTELGPRASAGVALLVNGLGATTPMELTIVARRALAVLRARGIKVERGWTGNFMTALEMPGCSLSLLPLDAERRELLDAASKAPAWPGPGIVADARKTRQAPRPTIDAEQETLEPGPISDVLKSVVLAVAGALEEAETELTDLDSRAGDGDLGASMERGARALRALPPAAFATPESLLVAMANTLRRAIAGSSGPFYATALMRAARRLSGRAAPTADEWAAALAEAVQSVADIGGAKPGDRTMLDALSAAVAGWERASAEGRSPREAWDAAAAAARAGALETASMRPRLGRASYLGERAIGVPDGGAVAVAIWMEAIANALPRETA
ncbi:dihydroxyacetone kinase family protein [Chelativorans sp. AA-79]|uniref:dihydroxyacetone kinase family protein n=1 Tax=Chelativorans sp. AA-79 TaxID=3028735 RepID=UPI0023F9F8BF|nr:dihydroxyacetone kinase family protein [Chelativorans sp. AA-79]WEX11022.1 dihydroxyacetone kinase family protein [Chelativorans sp. AA-79]